ncbi:HYR-like domain-containing protein, partial [Neptunitalea chrysea]|uniref:HYR-like domain-containing protein n=1 Tax=Neptunitalea chrysea TaxID=1647581 RepID=UPI0024920823
ATLATITSQCMVTETAITVPTATDNCVGTVTVTNDATFPITAQGTTVITWTYTDANGNSTTQTQNVIITDTTAPVADLATLSDITAECTVTAVDVPTPTATDNCNGTVTVTNDATFPITAQGTTVITWTYTDENGNASTQNQNVVIDDITAPVPDIAILSDITMQCQVTATDITTPTATDNCAGGITATTNDPLEYTAVGTYSITWIYEDGNGNSSTQDQTIHVTDSDLNAVTFTDASYTYNAMEQYITVDNLPAGATVAYSSSPSTGLGNGAINAGTYNITALINPAPNAPNCDPITLTATMTIEKAPQQIIFDPLPVKHLENDVDFQLTAYTTAGLPVYYTYTYTATNPPATVTSAGWVDMLTSGSVYITAHQDGNSNYLPADDVIQEQVIISSDSSIHSIVIDGVTYNYPDDHIYYLMECENSADQITVAITTEANATADTGHEFTISTPQPGIYNQTVTITSQDGTTTHTYYITVEKMFQFFDIVEQKFDNVLLANNNPATNGGYSFVAYQWYVNNQLISTDQYFSVGPNNTDLLDDTATYYLRLTTSTGDVLQTCLSSITLEHDYSMRVTPNPVSHGKQVTVMLDLPQAELDNTDIIIYDLYGKKVFTTKVNQAINNIQLPISIEPATYLVKCITPKREKTVKIIVQ